MEEEKKNMQESVKEETEKIINSILEEGIKN